MKYVLDSNVAIKWVLAESDSPKARQLRDEFVQGAHELLSPDVFELELAHALTRAERTARIGVGNAGILWTDVMTTCPLLIPSGPLTPQAITIASAARIGFYDCLFVALAEQEGCELVTADERLIKNLPGYPIVSLNSF